MKPNPHAAALGRQGGLKRSSAKTKSSRQNGRLGGRPAKAGMKDWSKFMDAVDECRREKLTTPLHALFVKARVTREKALICSTAWYLCREFQSPIPKWALQKVWLREPWFVSGVENLKAMALVESPLAFKANNIFVLNNFLSRV